MVLQNKQCDVGIVEDKQNILNLKDRATAKPGCSHGSYFNKNNKAKLRSMFLISERVLSIKSTEIF